MSICPRGQTEGHSHSTSDWVIGLQLETGIWHRQRLHRESRRRRPQNATADGDKKLNRERIHRGGGVELTNYAKRLEAMYHDRARVTLENELPSGPRRLRAHHDIVDSCGLAFSAAHGAFPLPKVRERRPCTAKRTAYETTVIGKPFALLLSLDSTITLPATLRAAA